MLQLKTLLNKQDFTKSNGDVVLDLIRRAVSFLNIRIGGGKAYLVTDETCMRPDLISFAFYQRADYADLILKYNGYSNPFSVNVGDILRIPDADTIGKFGAQPKLEDLGKARKKKSNVTFNIVTKRDKRRAEFLLKKAGAVPPVAPNVALDNSVKVANGKIVFGGDVTSVTKQDCPIPISRAKLMESLIKNKNAGK
jgi:hypothetical protein